MEHTYKKTAFIAHLTFKLNWASWILCSNPKTSDKQIDLNWLGHLYLGISDLT